MAPVVALYPKPLTELGIFVSRPSASLELITRDRRDQNHDPVIRENRGERGFILWGYNAGLSQVTESGRELFMNAVDSLR